MNFTELDGRTREWMLERFEAEEATDAPYRSPVLSDAGLAAWPDLMRQAIHDPDGNEVTLATSLNTAGYWNPTETYVRDGVARERKVNVAQVSQRLATTEFNTWYAAGLAHRLVDEGERDCLVYRAGQPKWEHASCSQHERQIYPLADVIDGHRIGYWPPPGVDGQFAIPAGPGCHHTLQRVS